MGKGSNRDVGREMRWRTGKDVEEERRKRGGSTTVGQLSFCRLFDVFRFCCFSVDHPVPEAENLELSGR